jgi:ubiquinone/menaquinone biosynthesis C-methylase UbiE
MSVVGRYVIDRMKRSLGQYLKFPVPPYGTTKFWDDAYRTIQPDDVQEWGQINFLQLYQYEYELYPIPATIIPPGALVDDELPSTNEQTIVTDIRETLAIDLDDDDELKNAKDKNNKKNPILIVGCGNSRFGEDMVDAKLQYPLVQLDVADSVIETMMYRCERYIENGQMQFILDDATELVTLNDNKITAAIDKGLADALFCADEYQQCYDMMYSLHRVLRPNGVACILSFSRPEFILPRLLTRTTIVPIYGAGGPIRFDPNQQVKALRSMWHSVQVRKIKTGISGIFLYRFQKSSPHHYGHTIGQATPAKATILNPNSKNR